MVLSTFCKLMQYIFTHNRNGRCERCKIGKVQSFYFLPSWPTYDPLPPTHITHAWTTALCLGESVGPKGEPAQEIASVHARPCIIARVQWAEVLQPKLITVRDLILNFLSGPN